MGEEIEIPTVDYRASYLSASAELKEARQRAERAEVDREAAWEELQNLKASANAECWRLASEMRVVVAALRSISWLPLQVEQIMPVIDRLDAALAADPSRPRRAGRSDGYSHL